MNCTLKQRSTDSRALFLVEQSMPGLSPLEQQLFAARNVAELGKSVPSLLAIPMTDLDAGANRLAMAIQKKSRMTVVADYDCDGATACATMVAGLRALGGIADYVVPDRMVHGYGISPSVVDVARDAFPDTQVLITVDNGILGHSGIDYAQGMGLDVVVTDHHLPGDTIPDALAVINPARADCLSELDCLAGVGVALWLVAATKRALQLKTGREYPNLTFLLPYVAVGTVADMVQLDSPNRALVLSGLEQIRKGNAPVGLTALIQEAGLNQEYVTTQDIGFQIAPRLNAAGRLESMRLGIDLLLTEKKREANKLAKLLTETNEARKALQREAISDAESWVAGAVQTSNAITKGSLDWHPGIVGLVASKLKETYRLPAFAFAIPQDPREGAKGSGRSIPGFHLKDALESIARENPGLLAKFGGHAMAAGVTLMPGADKLAQFEAAFDRVAARTITPEMRQTILLSDGPVPTMDMAQALSVLRHPWGQGFEPPAFHNEAQFLQVSPLGKGGLHWRATLLLADSGLRLPVVLFNQPEPIAHQSALLYLTPGLNTWKGSTTIQWQGTVLH